MRDGRRREGDLDAESALGAGVELQRAVVSGDDRGDDRQAEAVPVLRPVRSAPILLNGSASRATVA